MSRRVYAAVAILCFLGLFLASLMAPEFLDQRPSCGEISVKNLTADSGKTSVLISSSATHPNVDIAVDSLSVSWSSDLDGAFAKSSVTTDGNIQVETQALSLSRHTLTMKVTDDDGKTCTRCAFFQVGDDLDAAADGDCQDGLIYSYAKPWDTTSRSGKTITGVWPFGADGSGVSLTEYATQGARVIAFPAVIAGCLVALLAILGGLLRCTNTPAVEGTVQAFSELVGALPRLVIILVMVMLLPKDARSMLPIGIVWALLSAPSAMDEAGAVAVRLGGSRFVEALRAHGFSSTRIYLYHIVGLNLRPVVIRQAAEVIMQLAFLEVALSFLAMISDSPSISHTDNLSSWGELLFMGYSSLLIEKDVSTIHTLVLGLCLLGVVVLGSTSLTKAARAR